MNDIVSRRKTRPLESDFGFVGNGGSLTAWDAESLGMGMPGENNRIYSQVHVKKCLYPLQRYKPHQSRRFLHLNPLRQEICSATGVWSSSGALPMGDSGDLFGLRFICFSGLARGRGFPVRECVLEPEYRKVGICKGSAVRVLSV